MGIRFQQQRGHLAKLYKFFADSGKSKKKMFIDGTLRTFGNDEIIKLKSAIIAKIQEIILKKGMTLGFLNYNIPETKSKNIITNFDLRFKDNSAFIRSKNLKCAEPLEFKDGSVLVTNHLTNGDFYRYKLENIQCKEYCSNRLMGGLSGKKLSVYNSIIDASKVKKPVIINRDKNKSNFSFPVQMELYVPSQDF
ncbi:MAG: hypothetical protein ACTSXF_15695 [Promethearchaeota archaeon]